MDFWSRLLSRSPLAAGHSRRDIAKDPLRRRYRFEKEYNQLLQAWRKSSNLAHNNNAADTIEIQIQELTDILQDESRRPLPHTCLGFSAEKQIYVSIGRIAATSYNLGIIKEAVYFFGTLIESEDESFVENHTFSSSLTNLLVRVTEANSIRLDPETETRIVELAFNITTKIRLKPGLLPAWFHTHQEKQSPPQTAQLLEGDKLLNSHERFKGKTQRQDFPLFYILVDYVHSEGQVGDFARTGLLYIIEAASASASLEQWIVEGDLSTLMATGLGALYSQLSRKLVIDHPSGNLPPILALSDYEHPQATSEIVSSCSPDFQVQLETFLSHLLFWQDVLNHCHSIEVKSTLLEHFQVIFLQQLLYPSLLESSDIDGGSSVAVLTYLRRILESLDHPDMINLILHYLLALPNAVGAEVSTAKNAVSAARKRRSMDLATMMAARPDVAATPLLFNLVDLILACLKSHSQQTIHVTLQLVSVILRRHHRYAVMTLLRTEFLPSGLEANRTMGAHQQDVEFLTSIVVAIGGQDNFDETYDGIIKDTIVRLESHPCSLKLIAPKISTNNHGLLTIPDSLPGAPRDVPRHTLRPDDPLLATILDRLDTFFTNPVDTNLSVTEAILDLATCGFVALEGWVVRHPDSYTFSDDDQPPDDLYDLTASAGQNQSVSIKRCRQRPVWTAVPRLLSALQMLSEQVAYCRLSIPRFEDLLQQRRKAFQTADSVNPQGSRSQKPPKSKPQDNPFVNYTSPEAQRVDSPARLSTLEGLAQRFLSELATPSRSGSLRGGKDISRGSPLFGTNTSGSHGIASQILTGPAPKEFSLFVDDMSSETGSVNSWINQRGECSPPDSRNPAIASQIAAFQAVDREILARRVALPVVKVVTPVSPSSNKQSTFSVIGTKTNSAICNQTASDASKGSIKSNSVEGALTSDASTEATEEHTATVSHILTNAIILQSFSLELAALLQARAGLFDEVRFS